jgi:prenyltransferase beta subunit
LENESGYTFHFLINTQEKNMMKNGKQYLSTILLLTLVFLASAGVTCALAGDFDFAKTKTHARDIESRPDFPVSLVFARDYVYSLGALGAKIDPKKQKKVGSFIVGLQRQDGGFTNEKIEKESSILFTEMALYTLSLINPPPKADLNRAKTYIMSLRNADGGFGYDAKRKESTFVNTYYAIHALSLLNGLKQVDAAKTAAYIKSFENKSGGFDYVKGTTAPKAKFTYMAISTLKALGKLDEQTRLNALRFLSGTGYAKGNSEKVDALLMLDEMSYTIDDLKLLGAPEKIDKEKGIGILKQLYWPESGGFGSIPGDSSTPDSTTTGLRILAGVGIIKEPKTYPLVKK